MPLASPDAQVSCLHGDGSLAQNAMELDTAVRHKLPLLCVISLNGGWTAEPQGIKPGRYLGYARYDKMADRDHRTNRPSDGLMPPMSPMPDRLGDGSRIVDEQCFRCVCCRLHFAIARLGIGYLDECPPDEAEIHAVSMVAVPLWVPTGEG